MILKFCSVERDLHDNVLTHLLPFVLAQVVAIFHRPFFSKIDICHYKRAAASTNRVLLSQTRSVLLKCFINVNFTLRQANKRKYVVVV